MIDRTAHTKDNDFKLTVTGAETNDHQISIETLTQVLTGLQKTAYLLAAAKLNVPVQKRFAPNKEIKNNYTLRCGLPESGSYAVPISQYQATTVFDDASILDSVKELFIAVKDGTHEQVLKLIPDSRYREKVLREMARYFPKSGSNWGLSFSANGQSIAIENKAIRNIDNWLAPTAEVDTVMTVTGEMIRIDFFKNTIVLKYPPTNQEIECSYVQDIEDSIIENRRELIQVTGRFTLDSDSHPKTLSGVTRIEPVDLSELTFERITQDERELVFLPPLTFEPTLDESKQLFVIIDDSLNINVYAQTREQLAEDLESELFFLWDEYAQEDSENLTPKANKLKEELLSRCTENQNAA